MSSRAVVQKAWQQACKLLSQQSWSRASTLIQPCRTTVVVSRMYPPRQAKLHRAEGPFRPNIKRREFIYKFENNRTHEPAGDMELILTVDVEGMGFRGERVVVSKRTGRNFLLPAGAAEYVTEESLAKWEEYTKNLPESTKQSIWARKTLRKLEEMNLPIPMHPSTAWTLSPVHVKVAFRKVGVEIGVESIVLPEEPITQHGDVTFHVVLNQQDTVDVHGTIFPLNPVAPDDLPVTLPPVWGGPKLQLGETIRLAIQKQQEMDQLQQQQQAS